MALVCIKLVTTDHLLQYHSVKERHAGGGNPEEGVLWSSRWSQGSHLGVEDMYAKF